MMLTIANRIDLMVKLGDYMLSEDADWLNAKQNAAQANSWFTEEYIELAVQNIVDAYLDKNLLAGWVRQYSLPEQHKTVGIVMAGNIPLVGFHDFLCGFISGHRLMLKLSSKDEILIRQIIATLTAWQPEIAAQIVIADMLKSCDAYIATGSNNSARYFEQYFAKYPHIIRRNRTSVAVLKGDETEEELQALGRDVFSFFGLGCRNVTQLYVPEKYDFTKLLDVFKNHEMMLLHHKYKNNYDYHLAIYLLNKVPYLTNDSLLLVENELPFSAVSVLHYQYYADYRNTLRSLTKNDQVQCVISRDSNNFGDAQKPSISDYADGVDTMKFLCGL